MMAHSVDWARRRVAAPVPTVAVAAAAGVTVPTTSAASIPTAWPVVVEPSPPAPAGATKFVQEGRDFLLCLEQNVAKVAEVLRRIV